MIETTDLLLSICLFVGAILYTSVGHAGASAYIAIMTMFNVAVATVKPTALVLNIMVSAFTSWKYCSKGYYDLKLLIPVLLGAIPAAYLGGYIQAPSSVYKLLVGFILLVSAIKLFVSEYKNENEIIKSCPSHIAVLIGMVIGFLAGLTGTGGGIFLSPVVLFFAWSTTKNSLGTASIFILFNSIAGLLGNFAAVKNLPPTLPLFAVSVLVGALVGTTIGTKYASNFALRKILSVVLLIAALKLILTYF